jgi:hypothetical protein
MMKKKKNKWREWCGLVPQFSCHSYQTRTLFVSYGAVCPVKQSLVGGHGPLEEEEKKTKQTNKQWKCVY